MDLPLNFAQGAAPPVAHTRRLPPVVLAAGYVLAHLALDWISYVAPVAPFAITPWNPTAGLAIAFLLVFGLRYWPLLAVATMVAEAVVRGLPETAAMTLLNAAVGAAGYGLAAALLRAKLETPSIHMRRHFGWLVATAVTFALPVTASHVATLTVAGLLPAQEFTATLGVFWVGDVIGIVITTPALLLGYDLISRRVSGGVRWARPSRETLLQAAALAGLLWAVFGLPFIDETRFFYLLFIPLIWIALRRGFAGAVAATLCIQLTLVVWAYILDIGAIPVAELQALMLTLAVTGLFLGLAVSEHRDALQALQRREDELQTALRLAAATEMYSALAHELHQPLAAASHFAWAGRKILEFPEFDKAELKSVLEKALAEARRAGAVTQKLRDLYLGEAPRHEPLDLYSVIHEALSSLAARCAREKVMVAVAPGEPLVVPGDAVQLAMVVRNILGNAVDAVSGQEGARLIEVSVGIAEGKAVIVIEDSGPGIAPGLEGRVFAAFATTKERGLGLGLAISRSIVEAHGGRIWLRPSRLGGAGFCFSLPLGES